MRFGRLKGEWNHSVPCNLILTEQQTVSRSSKKSGGNGVTHAAQVDPYLRRCIMAENHESYNEQLGPKSAPYSAESAPYSAESAGPGQGPGGGLTPASAPPQGLLAAMQAAPIWLLWKAVPDPSNAKPKKVPFYVDGGTRGTTDTPEDRARLVTYDKALSVWQQTGSRHAGLAIALGPDGRGGCWQGIDLDDIEAKGLSDIANQWVSGNCAGYGYVELSPYGAGIHIIGYGRQFFTLGSKGSGIEAYAEGRFFTFTGNAALPSSPCAFIDLAEYVEQVLAPRHGVGRAVSASTSAVTPTRVDAKTVTELRSALSHMRADDYQLWVDIGHALKELDDVGRGVWVAWSQTSEKWKPADAKKWDTFRPTKTGYQAVFKKAQDMGWVNPASNAAQLDSAKAAPAQTGPRQLVERSLDGVSARAIDWLWTGWIPKGYITLFAGETGAGKSTVLADIAARVTTGAPWPGPRGIPGDRREPGRVLWLGSEDSIEEMTVPRLMACEANRANVREIQGVVQQGKRTTFSLQDDIEAVGGLLASAQKDGTPFAMLVIDPVTSYLPGQKLRKVDLSDAGQLRTILEPWLVLAQEYRIAIVCVTHFAKDTTRAMLHRVLGSAAFAQTCRSLCAVIERPATEDYEPMEHEKVLMQVKMNLPEHPGGAWKFTTEKVEVGKDPNSSKPIYATRPQWDELDNALTPKTAVGPARGPKSRQQLPFAIWLKGLFAVKAPGEWMKVDEVKWVAIREKVVSENWWNKHSPDHLEKHNNNGTWMCRPKATP